MERGSLRTEKERRVAEMECREIVEAGTTLMSCEFERLLVDIEGAVLEDCNECL